MLTILISVVCPRHFWGIPARERIPLIFFYWQKCHPLFLEEKRDSIYADITEAPPFHMDPRGCGNHTSVNLLMFRSGPFYTRRVVNMGGHLKLGKWRLTPDFLFEIVDEEEWGG
jgi:hypothetical protein